MIDQLKNEATPALGRIASQDALTAIRAENARVGLSVSETDELDMAHHLASAVRHDVTNNRTFIVDGAGQARTKMQDGSLVDLTVLDLIGMLQITAKPAPRSKSSPVPVAAGASRTERAVAVNAAKRSTEAEAKATHAADLVAEHGNPWHPRSINRTHQGLVMNANPVLAKQLKSQAKH